MHVITVNISLHIAYFYNYGDVRISGGGKSGQLEFYNGSLWGAISTSGFGYRAGNVACRQLGYRGSSDIYTYTQYANTF